MAFDDVQRSSIRNTGGSGEFIFTVTATDTVNPDVSKNYTLRVAAAGEALLPASMVDTVGKSSRWRNNDRRRRVSSRRSGHRDGHPTSRLSASRTGPITSQSSARTPPIHSPSTSTTLWLRTLSSDLPQWNVATSSVPIEGGSTTGDSTYDEGSDATVIATANAGYAFTNWTESGTVVSTSASYTFPVTADRTLVANFTALPTYAIGTSSTPSVGGITTGAGNYLSGDSATLTATANPGYVFSKWTSGSNQISTSASYTFTVSSAKNYVANFIVAGTQQTIATSASPVLGGAVSGGGNHASGDSATLIATANPGYVFSKWTEGSTTVSTSASFTFTVTGNRTLVAKFNEAFVVSTSSAPVLGGTTEMDSLTYKFNETAKAKAFPATGFVFSSWTENGVVVSTSDTYSFKVTGNRDLVANFSDPNIVVVSASCSPSDSGDINGEGEYEVESEVMVSAAPRAGFMFLNWTADGAVVSTEPDLIFPAAANVALVANFIAQVTITATTSDVLGGSVSGDGDYAPGTEVSLLATENPGYTFTGWTENGVDVASTPGYVFTANTARTLVANFIEIPLVVMDHAAPGSNELTIRWPSTAVGWTLEESPDLKTWTPSTLQVTTAGEENRCTIIPTVGNRYFRLKH